MKVHVGTIPGVYYVRSEEHDAQMLPWADENEVGLAWVAKVGSFTFFTVTNNKEIFVLRWL